MVMDEIRRHTLFNILKIPKYVFAIIKKPNCVVKSIAPYSGLKCVLRADNQYIFREYFLIFHKV